MKRFFLTCALLVLVTYSLSAIDIKRYKIKSGIVEYKIEGLATGTETYYFDDWGIKEAKFTKTTVKMMGFTTESNTLSISDKDWSYNIDLNEKTGTKMANKQIQAIIDDITEKEYEEFGYKTLKSLDAVQLGNETFLGRDCEVWDIRKLSSKTWSYQYVPLKTEVNMMGTNTYTATKFEPNARISADMFSVPKGIKITEEEMPDFDGEGDMFKMMQKAIEMQSGEEEND